MMKDIQHLKSVYFLGIGGIGMSALARYFSQKGINVSGYDRTSTPLTGQLSSEGMPIHFHEDISLIPEDTDLVIYTPAIPEAHTEFQYILKKGVPLKKRAEVLGLISDQFLTVAIAGTHGKTSTTTMIAHLLKHSDVSFLAFLGGISRNYRTNFLNNLIPASSGNITPREICVTEADEFDRSFLQLQPTIGIITSMDADHLDIYKDYSSLKESFKTFACNIKPGGTLITSAITGINLPADKYVHHFSYSLNSETAFHAKNIEISGGIIRFDLVTPTEVVEDLLLKTPGMFNLENAVAALATGYLLGLDTRRLREGISGYEGVERRFDIRIKRNDFVYIDDYAHHPAELKASIQAAREWYPGKRITGVFQPHLYSRTRDFADEFAEALGMLDDLILLDIYPAREQPIEGISSAILLEKTALRSKSLCRRDDLLSILKKLQPEVLMTLGAGDIDQLVLPITEIFS